MEMHCEISGARVLSAHACRTCKGFEKNCSIRIATATVMVGAKRRLPIGHMLRLFSAVYRIYDFQKYHKFHQETGNKKHGNEALRATGRQQN